MMPLVRRKFSILVAIILLRSLPTHDEVARRACVGAFVDQVDVCT